MQSIGLSGYASRARSSPAPRRSLPICPNQILCHRSQREKPLPLSNQCYQPNRDGNNAKNSYLGRYQKSDSILEFSLYLAGKPSGQYPCRVSGNQHLRKGDGYRYPCVKIEKPSERVPDKDASESSFEQRIAIRFDSGIFCPVRFLFMRYISPEVSQYSFADSIDHSGPCLLICFCHRSLESQSKQQPSHDST
jgi:hypothetical protein